MIDITSNPNAQDILGKTTELASHIQNYLEMWIISQVCKAMGNTELYEIMAKNDQDAAGKYIMANGFTAIWVRLPAESKHRFQYTLLRGGESCGTIYVWPNDNSMIFEQALCIDKRDPALFPTRAIFQN